ncbi:hypothetical protein B0T14DRAFT_539454 [Immersiella caudata]|uniref:FAD/NAD(P)-binding domain-containing protein n=1 Tax=Immersiella caudata TaxID=314043 RepID=A0AA39WE54_9PEZI|nr:hypothetical protein B0T14DRAFT_539454 [Immersiella caudata]
MFAPVKRLVVISASPAGAIATNILAQEKKFDLIRVFERQEGPGGWGVGGLCGIGDIERPPTIPNLPALATRAADAPVPIPKSLPAQTPKLDRPRFTEPSVYPYLETNVNDTALQFSQEPIPDEGSEWSVSIHGPNTPFCHCMVMKRYITSLFERHGYGDMVSYNTTVEFAEKIGTEWKVKLRREGNESDYWWVEWLDAVVVASGHFWVPYIPAIEGLEGFGESGVGESGVGESGPGGVVHSKHFRGRDLFREKRVVVVGASVSAVDVAVDLASTKTASLPVHAIVWGAQLQLHLVDEAPFRMLITSSSEPDTAGPSPFYRRSQSETNRVPGLYQHVVWHQDPTLLFVGAVGRRATLPPVEEMRRWEEDRVKVQGDGAKFTLVYPDFEDYFETLRRLAGEGEKGVGRKLPKFRREWVRAFMEGHDLRKETWRRLDAERRSEEAEENSSIFIAKGHK